MVPDPQAASMTRGAEALASLGFRRAGRAVPTHLGLGRGEIPSFLMPITNRSVAAASCWAFNGLRPRKRQLERAAVGAMVRATGSVGPLGTAFVLDDDAPVLELVAQIASMLGRPRLDFALGVGNLDQWWKPTLQLFDEFGRPAAYAKIGWTPLTAALVETEGDALDAMKLHPPARFSVPRLAGRLVWRGSPVVVSRPMAGDVLRADRLPAREVVDAVLSWSVPQAPGASEVPPLVETSWWASLEDAAAADPAFQGLLDASREVIGTVRARTAPWHGDLVPWNLAVSRSTKRIWIWDWEYSAPDAPIGLDAVHWMYQVCSVTQGDPVGIAAARAIDNLNQTLSDRWVTADEVRVMALAHPLELLARFARATRLGGEAARSASALSQRVRDVLR